MKLRRRSFSVRGWSTTRLATVAVRAKWVGERSRVGSSASVPEAPRLHEGRRLARKDREGLLQTLELRLTPGLLLLVGHGLGLALRLEFVQVGEHRVQLRRRRCEVLVVVLQGDVEGLDLRLHPLHLGKLR